MKEQIVDSDKHYTPEFYKPAPAEILEAYYPLIGEVASQFNYVDDLLSESLVGFINQDDDEIGWIVIAGMQFNQKVDLWEKILKWSIHDSDWNEAVKASETLKVKDISLELKDVATKRNKIVHADWEGISDKLLVKTKTKNSDKGVQHCYVSIEKSEFDKIIDQFDSLGIKLYDFDKYIFEKLK